MQGVKRRRLSVQAWREVLRRFDAGGEAVNTFCEREGLSASSLHRWRSRLKAAVTSGAAPAEHKATPEQAVAQFVDLGALGGTSMVAGRLDLKLDLGGGLTLHLVRG